MSSGPTIVMGIGIGPKITIRSVKNPTYEKNSPTADNPSPVSISLGSRPLPIPGCEDIVEPPCAAACMLIGTRESPRLSRRIAMGEACPLKNASGLDVGEEALQEPVHHQIALIVADLAVDPVAPHLLELPLVDADVLAVPLHLGRDRILVLHVEGDERRRRGRGQDDAERSGEGIAEEHPDRDRAGHAAHDLARERDALHPSQGDLPGLARGEEESEEVHPPSLAPLLVV